MIAINKFREQLLEEFYLDKDGETVRRKRDGYYGRFKEHDEVKFFKMHKSGRLGLHVPKTRTTISKTHLLCLLRGIQIPEGMVVDHIDGNFHNDSKENLRVVSQHENCKNKKMKSTNTSGFTGISWNKSGNSWTVRMTLKGKRIYLGSRNTLEEAKELYESYLPERAADGFSKRHGK